MPFGLQRFASPSPTLRRRLVLVYAALAFLNIGAWIWAFVAFRTQPGLLGVSLIIYGFGLRHAVDADHIAAIDNITRKLMQSGQRPVSVGFFFAMGHSTVVVLAAGAVATAASLLGSFETLRHYGGLLGTLASTFFLFAVAAMNVSIFIAIFKTYRGLRKGDPVDEQDIDALLDQRGLIARVCRPVFRLVTRSWHMYPVGFLFGLGFDTASEVAMFGVSAAQAAKGVPFAAILVFPVLFAAGMSLIDTTDNVLMLGVYDWALAKPIRRIYFNMTITIVSIVVALLIGGIEGLGLLGDRLGLTGRAWDAIAALNDNFNNIGFVIVGVFVAAWLVSYVVYRATGLHEADVASDATP